MSALREGDRAIARDERVSPKIPSDYVRHPEAKHFTASQLKPKQYRVIGVGLFGEDGTQPRPQTLLDRARLISKMAVFLTVLHSVKMK